jgi:hypothetical protein
MKIVHKARKYLNIAYVKTFGVTGDCGTCARIAKLREQTGLHSDELDWDGGS